MFATSVIDLQCPRFDLGSNDNVIRTTGCSEPPVRLTDSRDVREGDGDLEPQGGPTPGRRISAASLPACRPRLR